ncbi:MAG TPA: LL-diaminopimelate aminotransferase [Candidatus Fournierella merdigallinarum]|nr:LL-diaminopimelate aminotransferase [Candidatus Fournierella merdigallinarum]
MSQIINHSFDAIPQSYLFSEVARRVAAFRAAHPERQLIPMGIGDVTRPLCRPVIEALKKAAEEQTRAESFHGYGPEQGYDFLRRAVQAHYAVFGVQLDAGDIFISDGAKSDLGNLPDLFSQDCRVLLPDPVYPVYRDSNLMAGRKVEYLAATRENGFAPLPGEDLRADLVYLCSPANPTGAAYTKEQLAVWVDWALANDAVILYDAAYECFIREELPHSIYQVKGAERCAIEVCSLSKTAGFTGMRCGYTVVPQALVREGKSLRQMWLRRQCTKMNGVAYPVQRAAEAVFTPAGMAACKEDIDAYLKAASVVAGALEELGVWYCGGKNSPYIWMECPGRQDSWRFFDALLENAGIIGTPGSGFGENGKGYFRLSAFSGEENARAAMERLRAWLQS